MRRNIAKRPPPWENETLFQVQHPTWPPTLPSSSSLSCSAASLKLALLKIFKRSTSLHWTFLRNLKRSRKGEERERRKGERGEREREMERENKNQKRGRETDLSTGDQVPTGQKQHIHLARLTHFAQCDTLHLIVLVLQALCNFCVWDNMHNQVWDCDGKEWPRIP